MLGYQRGTVNDFSSYRTQLHRLDGKPYRAYKSLYQLQVIDTGVMLKWHHIQGDPFASLSRSEWVIQESRLNLPPWAFNTKDARRASADFFQRRLHRLCLTLKPFGQGRSGQVTLGKPGQEILDRSGVRIDEAGNAYCLISVGLPAQGRRILGHGAASLLCNALRDCIFDAFTQFTHTSLKQWVDTVIDQVALRNELTRHGLIAFIADGSLLARHSGAHDGPRQASQPCRSPEELAVYLPTPSQGAVRGLGIKAGITLIVGGGYHGKSTLLESISRGVYDHIPGDGREKCVACASTVSIRAEDGRIIRNVDISPLIGARPDGRTRSSFSTDDASGSTSQAAAIIESIELGAQVILMDEDTTASNFMVRDVAMRTLIPDADEPIIPFIERVETLYRHHGVSTAMVVGSAGAFLSVADTVIRMTNYQPSDATREAKALDFEALGVPKNRRSQVPWPPTLPRRVQLDAMLDHRHVKRPKVRSWGSRGIEIGTDCIDLLALTQLVDEGQLNCLADIVKKMLQEHSSKPCTLRRLTHLLAAELDHMGPTCTYSTTYGDRVRVRRFEIGAMLNRLPMLRVTSSKSEAP